MQRFIFDFIKARNLHTSKGSKMIYHKFPCNAISYMFNGEHVEVILEYLMQ